MEETHAASLSGKNDKKLRIKQLCYCNYKDADSGMSYHLSLVATPSNVVMRTNDLPFQWNVSSFMTTH